MNDGEIVRHPHKILRQIIHDGSTICTIKRSVTILTIRRTDDFGGIDSVLRQLILYIKLPDTLYLVAEEIQSVGEVVAVAVYIYYSASDGVLPGLKHKIHPLKSQVRQPLTQLRQLNFLPN